jgi:hypothetical protein
VGDDRFKVKKPCNECPYSRKCEPNSLGGSDPKVYVGQGHGPFWLPCHRHTDFEDPNWKTDLTKPQCAGAAMYRDLQGLTDAMPDALHKLTGDPKLVFETPAELLAHHYGCPLSGAEGFLILYPAEELALREYMKVKAGQEGWELESKR